MSTPSPFTVTKDGLSYRVELDAHYISDEEMQALRRYIADLKDENARLRSCLSDDAENARMIMAENAKLREQIHWLKQGDILHVLTDQEYIDQQKHEREMQASIKALDDENAKLRELVWDLYCLAYPSTVEWEVSDETYDKYSPCEKCQELHGGKSPCASTARDMDEECCTPIQANVVADRMRELGVEV